jgi:hypothetical protein
MSCPRTSGKRHDTHAHACIHTHRHACPGRAMAYTHGRTLPAWGGVRDGKGVGRTGGGARLGGVRTPGCLWLGVCVDGCVCMWLFGTRHAGGEERVAGAAGALPAAAGRGARGRDLTRTRAYTCTQTQAHTPREHAHTHTRAWFGVACSRFGSCWPRGLDPWRCPPATTSSGGAATATNCVAARHVGMCECVYCA